MGTPQDGAHGPIDSPLSPPLSPTTAAVAALTNARWNPNMEQVAVLEGLYEAGLRASRADQIQHLTVRLRQLGPVEAKDVFYWFQNHRGRHPQMQQDNIAHFTRLQPPPIISRPPGQTYQLGWMPASSPMMTMAPPPPPAAYNNGGPGGTHVMYRGPYYMPAPPPQASTAAYGASYYNYNQQHHAAHHMPSMYQRMGTAQDKQQMNPGSVYQQAAPYGTMSNPVNVDAQENGDANGGVSADHVRRTPVTLELFPLQPTFVLPDNNARGASFPTSPSTPPASTSFPGGESESLVESPKSNAAAPTFYDFFGLDSAVR